MKKVIFIALTLLSLTTSLVSCYTYETVTKYSYESAQDDLTGGTEAIQGLK